MRPEPFSPTVVVNRELLKERLSPIEYQVTQEKQTERYKAKLPEFRNFNLQVFFVICGRYVIPILSE